MVRGRADHGLAPVAERRRPSGAENRKKLKRAGPIEHRRARIQTYGVVRHDHDSQEAPAPSRVPRARPIWCAWQVTYRCNFRCRICSYWQERHPASEELTVDQFARGAENLARSASMLINLAGGEPMLRPDLGTIVEVLARQHIPFLTTNGWRLEADRARELWAAGLWGVSVSIDYPDAARHDAQRGTEGAFEEAVRAIETFRDSRTAPHQRVNLMAVLTAANQDVIGEVAALAARLGATSCFSPTAS